MAFYEKLEAAWERQNSMVCVGLDPDLERIPKHIRDTEKSIFAFNKKIIDSTAEFACAFKPQIAHYAAVSAEAQLEETISYIRDKYPHHVVVLDAKRGDIGSTAEMYSKELYRRYGADAVTVNPYMGGDTISPFSNRREQAVFVLCRTSNPGAADLQEQILGDKRVFEWVADKVARDWNENENLGLVIGATAPEQLRSIRNQVGDIPFLVPGVGAQGGSVKDVVLGGRNSKGRGLLINSSRGIIYAGNGLDFAEKARTAAKELCSEINSFS